MTKEQNKTLKCRTNESLCFAYFDDATQVVFLVVMKKRGKKTTEYTITSTVVGHLVQRHLFPTGFT